MDGWILGVYLFYVRTNRFMFSFYFGNIIVINIIIIIIITSLILLLRTARDSLSLRY